MPKFLKIFRYLLAGGTATASNLLALFVLVHYLGLWYLLSAAVAFCVGVVVSYTLQKFFVFRNYSTVHIRKQFSHFFLFALVMLGFNTLLVYILVDLLHIWYLLAQAISALFTACINYTYFNKIIFAKDGE